MYLHFGIRILFHFLLTVFSWLWVILSYFFTCPVIWLKTIYSMPYTMLFLLYAQSLSSVWLFATPWIIACQAPLSMNSILFCSSEIWWFLILICDKLAWPQIEKSVHCWNFCSLGFFLLPESLGECLLCQHIFEISQWFQQRSNIDNSSQWKFYPLPPNLYMG